MMLLLAGCATTTEKLQLEQDACLGFAKTEEATEACKTPLKEHEQRVYEREDRAIRSREAFEIKKRKCLRSGGFILIRRRGPMMPGKYGIHEMNMAECVK